MSSPEPRLTAQTLKVLGILMSSGTEEVSGVEIARVTKLASGTLYPILFRLERSRWVTSHWESKDPSELGRPRKRLYKITGLGIRKAKLAFAEINSTVKEFAWQW
jgi:DNA-binding PadR family transcriptional regulator